MIWYRGMKDEKRVCMVGTKKQKKDGTKCLRWRDRTERGSSEAVDLIRKEQLNKHVKQTLTQTMTQMHAAPPNKDGKKGCKEGGK
mmetsp:Transcript_39866/g.78607  ORF Transcript_39866/g.78607 Transcript_39866/m.78607 type:complete len:85 (+) Transcript_39866:70-324(+)